MEGLTFFDILIILFLVFSFLSSIFKSKKRKEQPGQKDVPQERPGEPVIKAPPPAPVPYSTKETVETDEEEYDIMKEIESFFKVGEEEEEKPRQRRFEPMIPPAPEKKSEPVTVSQKSTYDKGKEKSSVQFDTFAARSERIKADTEKRLKELEKYKVDTSFFEKTAGKVVSKEKENFAFKFKQKIKEPDNLKEFILFSELIGRPKVFRRR